MGFRRRQPADSCSGGLEGFCAERKQRGVGDLHFLRRVFHKLIMNYTWWLNRKDNDGLNVFEGGFLGLDNISVYARSKICACPFHTNEHGERLLSLVNHEMIPQILQRLLNEKEFLAMHGIRSVSKIHADHPLLGRLPGLGETLIEYEPGESTSSLFGGNSNWRGPVWIPISYSILQALTKFHRFLGPNFTVSVPAMADQALNLREVADLIADCMITLFRRDKNGVVPSLPGNSPFQNDPAWRDLRLFHEYFQATAGWGSGRLTRPAGPAWSPI